MLAVLVGAVAVWGAAPPVVANAASGGAALAARVAVPAAGSWGGAIEVPGLGALNTGEGARVVSVSCASAGNCAAGGHYQSRHSQQGFVASERHGRWGRAIEIPGLGKLNKGGGADLESVSCGSAGDCTAGGFYSYNVAFFRIAAFVVTERRGQWGNAVALPTGDGEVNSVSCASAGTCLAGGDTASAYFYNHNAFLVQEQVGHWGHLMAVPGLRTLRHVDSWISSVACPSAGDCTVAGGYDARSGGQQAFVVTERHGLWGMATEVPGLATLNAGGNASIVAVSCGAAGTCAAGGYYVDGAGNYQGFVASEDNGVWLTAIEVPGLAALNAGNRAAVNSLSCGAAGNCTAVGAYTDAAGHRQGFVAVQDDGTWGTATGVPGLPALNKDGNAQVRTVSCASAGSCAAGGFYTNRSGRRQGFVAEEDNGVWLTAIEVPGLAALSEGGPDGVITVSCGSPDRCAAGGVYTDASGHHQGFVTQPVTVGPGHRSARAGRISQFVHSVR